jgi:hypothetical protein
LIAVMRDRDLRHRFRDAVVGGHGHRLAKRDHLLMSKLVHALEVSLRATEAARDAVAEILKRGAATGIFFAQGRGTPPPPASS